MTATAGFLDEPRPGYIAHTTLSAHFVSDLSYLDATMLLAGTAAPAALQMTTATRRGFDGHSDSLGASAYCLAFNTTQTFQSACEQRPRLQRQWLAYLRHIGAEDDGMIEALNGLGLFSLSNACVVDVSEAASISSPLLMLVNDQGIDFPPFPIGWCVLDRNNRNTCKAKSHTALHRPVH